MTAVTARHDPYPSRLPARQDSTGDAADRLLPRTDPVVWGEGTDGPLDPELVSAYEEHGYLVLPGLLPPSTIASLDARIAELAADDDVKGRPEAILEPDPPPGASPALRSLFEVHRGDDALGALSRDPRLTGIARQLLGSPVYVHQSRINLKPGLHGKEFYWHSDFETWHTEDGMPRMRALSASVLLTPNHSYNGPLLTIDGSHRWFVPCVGETPEDHHLRSLRRQELGVPDDDSLVELTRRGRINECTGMPGTVVIFDSNLMHGSNGNISPLERRNVFLVYNSVENVLDEPYAAPAPRPSHIADRDPDPRPV